MDCLTDLVRGVTQRLNMYEHLTKQMQANIMVNENRLKTIEEYKELIRLLLSDLEKCKALEVKETKIDITI